MRNPISDIAFTPAVKAAQEARGSRSAYAKMEQRGGWNSVVTPALESFIADREFFYLGTASADGQPDIQYRGGPKGFLETLEEFQCILGKSSTEFSSLQEPFDESRLRHQ